MGMNRQVFSIARVGCSHFCCTACSVLENELFRLSRPLSSPATTSSTATGTEAMYDCRVLAAPAPRPRTSRVVTKAAGGGHKAVGEGEGGGGLGGSDVRKR